MGWAFATPYYRANYSGKADNPIYYVSAGTNQYVHPLEGTVFHTTRYQDDRRDMLYDSRTALIITETLLNDVPTTITLSTLSLGTWWDKVPVITTRYRSTYSFANPINLILLYSIRFVVATLFAFIAIWSLWQNSIPVEDNSFLQIMIATRGNTTTERLVLREKLLAVDSMSEELRRLEIRYSELLTDEPQGLKRRKLGFGTIGDTISLRKERRGFE
jgi:hypothetical protein